MRWLDIYQNKQGTQGIDTGAGVCFNIIALSSSSESATGPKTNKPCLMREDGAVALPRTLCVHAVDEDRFLEFKNHLSGLTADNIVAV